MIDPTFSGVAGRAWLVPKAPARVADHEGGVAGYLIEQPGVHAFWSRWLIGCVHLRPIPGVKPAYISLPGATHEFFSIALDPEKYPNHEQLGVAHPADIDWGYMSPPDVIQQFQVPGDQFAEKLVELSARACCDGFMSPDSDFRARWEKTILETAEHYRLGKHAFA